MYVPSTHFPYGAHSGADIKLRREHGHLSTCRKSIIAILWTVIYKRSSSYVGILVKSSMNAMWKQSRLIVMACAM
jgi:hypothetical protein